MRSRKIEYDAPPESESEALSLSPSPAPRIVGNLSSMVVKPSLSSGGGSDPDVGYAADDRLLESSPRHLRNSSPRHLRNSSPRHLRNSSPRHLCRDSPQILHRRDSLQVPHRGDSPVSMRRRLDPSPLHSRGSPEAFGRRFTHPGQNRGGSLMGFHRRGSPPAFHPQPQRPQNGPGYIQRSGSVSPPHRPWVDDSYSGQDFGHPRGSRSGRGMRGRAGRSREVLSPAFGRGGRSYARGSNSFARAVSPIDEDYIHRNDPNLSPREGDWICRNPSCGNLNFARRTYCNNCEKFRYDEPYGPSHSPRRGYVSPPPRDFSQRLPVSPIGRALQRDFNVYRSPPRGWDMDDPNRSIIPPRRGGKSFDPVRRESAELRKDNFRGSGRGRGSGRSSWHVNDWEPRGPDAFVSNGRGVNRRPLSPRDRWIRDTRDRSRSPAGGRLPRNSFAGRGRDDRRFDGPYAGNGKAGNFDTSRGRGYRRGAAQVRSPDLF